MVNNKMNQEFQKRMKQGVKTEAEQLQHINKVRESIINHKYGVSSKEER